MYRQGDVLIIAASDVELAKAKKTGNVVVRQQDQLILAYGENPGHTHRILETHVEMIAVNDQLFIQASCPFTVVHEEHAPVNVPSGAFRVIRQREYTPSTGFTRIAD